MQNPNKPVRFMLGFSGFILLVFLIMQPLQILEFHNYIPVLFPKGIVALKERNLLLIIQALMLLIIFPVYILTFVFSWKYSATNPQGIYDPDLVDNTLAEYIWWGLPFILTMIVGILSWTKTQELDPFKPLVSDKKRMTIQVVALQWNWLFIYPEEKIATLNFVQFPEQTPIHFEITADAPMNSFWIPQLGGQIYAMPKMKTELNLMADEVGDFRGSSANLSGVGFAGMNFITRASTEEAYRQWIEISKKSTNALTFEAYNEIAKPTLSKPAEVFQLKDEKLFDQIINKYMHPQVK